MFGDAKKGGKKDPVEQYIDMILQMALDNGVDKITFGKPGDDLPRETCMRDGWRWLEPFYPAEIIAELNDTKAVPIWQRKDGKWHELPGFPWYLLHEVVRHVGDRITAQPARAQLADSIESTVPLKSKPGEINVVMTLRLEPNYCYSITLKKVD